ncbi:MAG: NAD-dependent epimerase/dehydratase family protein [Candidatus Bathyarchaeota archaeon]|nr:NAD-dependent epimerase/dehydratase family protein [Candidatus Bathyarchaeota archaeon]
MKAFEETEIAVTGGAGFIGSHLCKTLLEHGAKVIAYDDLSTGKIAYIERLLEKGLKFVRGDIRNSVALEEKTRSCKTVFHLAAQTSVPFSMKNPKEDCEINVVGTLNALEMARKADARLVFASSAAVYGNPDKRPTPENYPVHPVSFYGLSKCLGEDYCRFYYENYGLEVVILRIFNAYGLNCHGVMADFLEKLRMAPARLEVLGTGKQSRDFIHVSDLVRLCLLTATSPIAAGQVYNVGFGTTILVSELAKKIVDLLGLEGVRISFGSGQAWEGDMLATHADISKAMKDFHWRPLTRLEDGLKSLIRRES